jgi:hypothetical protein
MADKGSGSEPKASRPRMAGYDVPESLEGALPWDWAQSLQNASHRGRSSSRRNRRETAVASRPLLPARYGISKSAKGGYHATLWMGREDLVLCCLRW